MEILEEEVNKFVVEVFNKHGNFPRIEANSKFILVIGDRLVETKS